MPQSDRTSDKQIREKLDIGSIISAVEQQLKTYPEHEYCDGSCTGQQILNKLSLSGEPGGTMSRKTQPRIVPTGRVCQDGTWLEQQNRTPFEYSALGSGDAVIRLVRIKHAYFPKDIIECDMKNVDLNTNPGFAALSYYWGPRVFNCQMICNGKLMAITATLNAALKRVRNDFYSNYFTMFVDNFGANEHLIWVDALCINQNDEVERDSQVRLMRRIYSQATVVHVDLGHTDLSRSNRSEWFQGYDLLKRLASAAKDIVPTSRRESEDLYSRFGIYPTHPAWVTYLDIFAMPWFQRTWTVQDVVLAKNAMVRFGDFTFSWSLLSQSFKMLEHLEFDVKSKEVVRGFEHLKILERLIDVPKHDSSGMNLLSLLQLTTDFSVSDPKDKIHALLGLAGVNDQLNGPHFTADYSMSTEALYLRCGIYFVRTNCADQMLPFAGLQHRSSQLREIPSWVPDWSSQSNVHCSPPVADLRPTAYTATPGTKLHARLKIASSSPKFRSNILVMKRKIVDRLAFVSETLCLDNRLKTPNDLEAMIFLHWHQTAERQTFLHYDKSSPRQIYTDILESFICTLLMDSVDESPQMTEIRNLKTTYSFAMSALQGIARDNSKISLSYLEPKNERDTLLRRMLEACSGRKVAVTQRGLIGLVPRCTKLGDQVNLFHGVSVPFITRDSERSLTIEGHTGRPVELVGDAYIHGLMRGEAMGLGGNSDEEDVWIC
ncbi:uncharacterized protein KY384_000104 [Bacidia gigantensis]|uniref:uncharacterized protein n=1 Tax=Bacidia gigantensis TaxID=2732470 RepID=UPI001D045981|nr:uncharacterized protein KY384_000104 [Bacidia gigantensis]KAG8526111.1 hypothetical protein KY384_000104 [Bacidia gigantensis]